MAQRKSLASTHEHASIAQQKFSDPATSLPRLQSVCGLLRGPHRSTLVEKKTLYFRVHTLTVDLLARRAYIEVFQEQITRNTKEVRFLNNDQPRRGHDMYEEMEPETYGAARLLRYGTDRPAATIHQTAKKSAIDAVYHGSCGNPCP